MIRIEVKSVEYQQSEDDKHDDLPIFIFSETASDKESELLARGLEVIRGEVRKHP